VDTPLRIDAYQAHPTPDTPQESPGQLDSAVDQALIVLALTDPNDTV
jgi:hypothetical protein